MNNGPNAEASADHAKVTRKNTLLSPNNAIVKTIAVTVNVPNFTIL